MYIASDLLGEDMKSPCLPWWWLVDWLRAVSCRVPSPEPDQFCQVAGKSSFAGPFYHLGGRSVWNLRALKNTNSDIGCHDDGFQCALRNSTLFPFNYYAAALLRCGSLFWALRCEALIPSPSQQFPHGPSPDIDNKTRLVMRAPILAASFPFVDATRITQLRLDRMGKSLNNTRHLIIYI